MLVTRIDKKPICRHSDWFFSRCSEGGKRVLLPRLAVEGGRKQHFMACRRKKEYNWDQVKKFYMRFLPQLEGQLGGLAFKNAPRRLLLQATSVSYGKEGKM